MRRTREKTEDTNHTRIFFLGAEEKVDILVFGVAIPKARSTAADRTIHMLYFPPSKTPEFCCADRLMMFSY